jgi:hypothetical protein
MNDYIVIKDNEVVNIINAPSLEIAEEATGSLCIKREENSPIIIGWTYVNNTFAAPETPTE